MKPLQNECQSSWKTKLRGQIPICGSGIVHVRCFSEACPPSALLSIFLPTWMMEKRICLLNLHVDDMLGGTFDRIRIQHDPVSLNTPPSVLGCCGSEENATPVSSCDVCSACEESSFLLSSVKASVGRGAPCPQLKATLQKKSGPAGEE